MSDNNEYSDIVQQFANPQPARPNVQAGLALAADANPDYEAELRKLAAKTGVPLDTARNMEPEIRKQAFIADANPSLLETQYPKVAEFLANPDNAAVAKDDIGTMQKVANLWASFETGISRGSIQDQIGPLHYRALTGDISPSEEATRQELKRVMEAYGRGASKETGFGYFLNQTGYAGRQLVSSLREGGKGALGGAAAGAGAAALIGQLGPQIAVPEEIVTVPGAAALGARAGYIGNSVVYNYKQEAGFAFDEFSDFKDETGRVLDRQTAQGAAAAVGLINAGLETVGDLAMAKLLPGVGDMLSQGGKGVVKELLKRPTFRQAIASAGAKWLKAATTEGVTEAIQEVTAIIGGELAQKTDDVVAQNQQSAGDRIMSSGVDAFVGALGVGAGGAGYQGYRGVKQAQAAQQSQDFMTALGEAASESKLAARMPEKWREFIAKAKEGGPVDNVYIPVEQFNQYFQTAGVDPAEVAVEIGAKNYSEALATGSDIAIPLEDYATHIAPTEHHAQLMQDARLHQGDMTPREYAAFQAERDERMKQFADEIGSAPVDETSSAYTTIKNEMMGELVGRFDRGTAESYATLYAKGIATLAERAGIDPMELHQRYGLTVTRAIPDVLKPGGNESDIGIDPLLDRLRSGDIPSDLQVFGVSLAEFVRSKGGLKDEGGDVRAMDADKGKRPFQKNMIQPGGLSYDAMRELAAEYGFIPQDASEADFLSLLDDELQGVQATYADRNQDQQLFALREQLQAIDQALNELGIDLNSLTNEEVRAAIRAASQVMDDATEYAQSAPTIDDFSAFGEFTVEGGKLLKNGEVVGDIKLDLETGKVPHLVIRDIRINSKGQGIGTEAIKAITDKAAEFNLPVALTSEAMLGKDHQRRLRAYYERIGFRPNNGENKIPGIKEEFVLMPPGVNKAQILFQSLDGSPVLNLDAPLADQSYAVRSALRGEIKRMRAEAWNAEHKNGDPDTEDARITGGQLFEIIADRLGSEAEATAYLTALGVELPAERLFQADHGVDEATGLPLNADGTVTVYHHTSADNAEQIRKSGVLKSAGEPDVYVTTRQETDTGYGDTAVAINVDPALLQIDDEFPDGRVDYRIDTGKPGGAIKVKFPQADAPTLDEFKADLAARYPDVKIDLYGKGDKLNLSRIVVPEGERTAGTGTAIMQEIVDYADATGKTVTLSPSADFGGTVSRLKEFYKRFGFVENKGRAKDFEISESMYRLPRMNQNAHDDKRGFIQFGKDRKFSITLLDKADLSTFLHETGHFWLEVMGDLAQSSPELRSDFDALLKWFGVKEVGEDQDAAKLSAKQTELMRSHKEAGEAYRALNRARVAAANANWSDEAIAVVNDLETKLLALEGGEAIFDLDDQIREAREAGTKAKSAFDVWNEMSFEEKTEFHEQFARGFEAYLMEGKAPSAELRTIFQKFKAWLTLIYKQLSNLNVKLNDDVRGVFDRIIASDAEIEGAKSDAGMTAIFATAADAGMTEAEFAAYTKTVQAASDAAKESLERKLMAEYKRAREQWYKDERAKVRDEVERETEEQPVYLAFDALVAGQLADGTPIKLNRDDLHARYGAEYVKRIPRSFNRVYAAQGGMNADMAAEVFGFQSGDELVEALVNMRPKRQVVEAETDARMRDRYGDLQLDGTIHDDALAAIHNDERANVLAAELRALRRRQRDVSPILNAIQREQGAQRRDMQDSIPPISAVRDMARGMIGQKQIRDLVPNTYLLAERKASREAFNAAAKGDWQVAAAAKQRELLNHYLYRESVKALESVDAAVDYAKTLEKPKTQERIGKAGESYLNAINDILSGYEFRKVPNKALDVRQNLRAAMAAAEAEGEVIDVMTNEAGEIIDPALVNVKNYRELSVDELMAVRDTLKNIEHVAKEKGSFRAAEVKATFDEIALNGIEEIADGTKDVELAKRSMRDPKNERLRAIAGIPQSWRSLYSYIQEATGFKENSTLWNYIVRPLNDAAAKESVMLKDAAEKLDDLFKQYGTTYLYGKGKVIPGVGPLNKMEQLMIAASYGTETGKQRLLDNGFNGTGFSQQELDMILNSLEEKDWQFVQDLWKLFDSYWSQVEDKQQRVTGVRPEKVAAVPFQTKFGTMPGGYSPIAYETRADNRAAAQDAAQIANEMKQAAYTRNTTRRGFTKQRVDKLEGKKVRYDFGVIYKHLNEVIHDLTHHEALRDVQKLLNHKVEGTSIIDEITRRMGDGVRDEIRGTLEEVAVGDMRQMTWDEKLFERLAKGSSMAAMSYNVWNAVQNATGVFNSMGVIGAANFIGGAKRWTGSPKHMLDTVDAIYEKSPFMRTRAINMNRDVNALKGKLEQMTGKPIVDKATDVYKEAAFWMLVRMQQMVDVPTWLGAYEAAKRGDPSMTEANAVALADQAVIASQGGGRTVDLSKFMRGKGWQRVWTVFAGYFNVTYQRVLEAMKKAKVEDYSPAAVGRAVTDIGFLMAAPAMMTTLMKEGIDVLVGDDDEDEDSIFTKYLKDQFSYLLAMFPYVRETAGAFAGYGGYSGPVGARFFADLNKLITQAKQGDLDENLGKAAVRTAGSLTGLPTGQMIKTYDGAQELAAGNATPLALAFGPPKD